MAAITPPNAYAQSVAVTKENFPDENLYNYLLEFDEDGNGILEGWEYESTYFNDFDCKDVLNFKGLELFPITHLNIYYTWIEENPLASMVKTIDLSMLPDLEGLFIYDVLGLETLDISRNTKLTSLRLSYCPALKDIKWASSLESLDIQDLQSLSSINGSEMPNLLTLESSSHAHVSSVNTFNFTGHKNIESIYIHGNEDFTHNLNTFHVENCLSLTYLEVNYSTVQDFTMKNLPGFEYFEIKNTTAENVNIQECPELKRVMCEENELGTLQLSNNPKLWDVDCHDNKLKTLIADNCPKLESLWAWDNQLMWLDMKDVEKSIFHNEDIEGNPDFMLDNQNPHVVAYKISPTEVGLRVHDRLDVSRVSNLKAKGLAMEPKEIFVDGIRYFVIYNNGPQVESLVHAEGCSYQYDTKWPYPYVNGNSEDNLLPVTYHVDSWRKPDSFIRIDGPTLLRGEYGQPAPATPGIIRSQDYDGVLAWASSNPGVVSIDAATGAMTVHGVGTATITVRGGETDYRNAPATITFTVVIDKIKDVQREVDIIWNNIGGT